MKFLKQGLTPSKLALVFSLGFTLSVFPLFGSTTILCALVAIVFRLNLPVIQLANYVAFPLQIILFFPFLSIGELLLGKSLDPISASNLLSFFDSGIMVATESLLDYLVPACLGWALSTFPIFFTLYFVLLNIIRRYISLFH